LVAPTTVRSPAVPTTAWPCAHRRGF